MPRSPAIARRDAAIGTPVASTRRFTISKLPVTAAARTLARRPAHVISAIPSDADQIDPFVTGHPGPGTCEERPLIVDDGIDGGRGRVRGDRRVLDAHPRILPRSPHSQRRSVAYECSYATETAWSSGVLDR